MKNRIWALLPFVVFLVFFAGAGKIPVVAVFGQPGCDDRLGTLGWTERRWFILERRHELL